MLPEAIHCYLPIVQTPAIQSYCDILHLRPPCSCRIQLCCSVQRSSEEYSFAVACSDLEKNGRLAQVCKRSTAVPALLHSPHPYNKSHIRVSDHILSRCLSHCLIVRPSLAIVLLSLLKTDWNRSAALGRIYITLYRN